MLFAKVVVGLPVDGIFDYKVEADLIKKISIGKRVIVNFRNKKEIAFVTGISERSTVKNLKSIIDVIDDAPVLDEKAFSLCRKISGYYGCSLGEAIQTWLPIGLRIGKRIIFPVNKEEPISINNRVENEVLVLHDPGGRKRWDFYFERIGRCLKENKTVIVLFADKESLAKYSPVIINQFGSKAKVFLRGRPEELQNWIDIKLNKISIVVGVRSSVFAPLTNPGLIIVDEEQEYGYKQDQTPHYHAREAALFRAQIEKADLILAGRAPSLESYYKSHTGVFKYLYLPPEEKALDVNMIDMRNLQVTDKKNRVIFSKFLQDSIFSALISKGKILLFLNRKGFASYSICSNCGHVLKCPRCNINLVYHFKGNMLSCHYCNFKLEPPKICPECKTGYIKFLGAGTEKIESEISRIFPQARIQILDEKQQYDLNNFDIFVSTQSVIKHSDYNFDLIGVIGIDNIFNHVDFRATEDAFGILIGLRALTDKKMVVQTNLGQHYCFQAVKDNNPEVFYKKELEQRKELKFPPYCNFILIKIRGKNEERVKQSSIKLFNILESSKLPSGVKLVSFGPADPAKLRGNYYWNILIKTRNVETANKFIKIKLKNFNRSGIIMTVVVDPI